MEKLRAKYRAAEAEIKDLTREHQDQKAELPTSSEAKKKQWNSVTKSWRYF